MGFSLFSVRTEAYITATISNIIGLATVLAAGVGLGISISKMPNTCYNSDRNQVEAREEVG